MDCAWPGFKIRIWLSEKQLWNLRCHRITMVQATESRKGLNLSFTRRECRSDTIMARIVSGKSESSFSQVIHSAGVRRFGEAQAQALALCATLLVIRCVWPTQLHTLFSPTSTVTTPLNMLDDNPADAGRWVPCHAPSTFRRVAHDLVEEGLNPHTKVGNEIWARVPAKVPAVGFWGEQPGVVKSSRMSGEPGRTRTCNPLISADRL